MFNIKALLALSDDGCRGFRRAVFGVVLSNLSLLLPFVIIIRIITALLEPLLSPAGAAPDFQKLWLLFGAGIVCAALYFLAYRNEYRKTYTAAYSETEKIRIEAAEHLRRLPLSFFNNKDLSELTTNMMGDCTSIEHTMSHVVPGLFADIITITIACVLLALYDWRMSLALFAALPIALGLVIFTRKLQARFGERHVAARLRAADEVQEYLEGIKVVKAFGLAGEKSKSLERALRNMMKESIKFEGMAGIAVTLAMMILQAGMGLVILAGVLLLTGGNIDSIKLITCVVISA
ncbi:MAG: ABC transporter ATP-binding protein, partial [Treponema sp.]|nr:ABC transporter ATP-binding protein [Treponema sp.]